MEPGGERWKEVLVGCLMRTGRLEAFQARGILPSTATAVPGREPTLRCLAFDHGQDPRRAPHVHVLLHKLSDFDGVGEGAGHAWVRAYSGSHPGTRVVDPPATLGPALDRAAMARAAERASALSGTLRALRWAALEGPADDGGGTLEFPCVVKAREACGTPAAHVMAVVESREALQACPVPCPRTAQEWVEGGGCVLKVYVAGGATAWSLRVEGAPAHVDGGAGGADADAGACRVDHVGQKPDAAALDAGAALRQTLGWTLFGADLVCCRRRGLWSIVDINYFPSFTGIEDAGDIVHRALVDCATGHNVKHASR